MSWRLALARSSSGWARRPRRCTRNWLLLPLPLAVTHNPGPALPTPDQWQSRGRSPRAPWPTNGPMLAPKPQKPRAALPLTPGCTPTTITVDTLRSRPPTHQPRHQPVRAERLSVKRARSCKGQPGSARGNGRSRKLIIARARPSWMPHWSAGPLAAAQGPGNTAKRHNRNYDPVPRARSSWIPRELLASVARGWLRGLRSCQRVESVSIAQRPDCLRCRHSVTADVSPGTATGRRPRVPDLIHMCPPMRIQARVGIWTPIARLAARAACQTGSGMRPKLAASADGMGCVAAAYWLRTVVGQ